MILALSSDAAPDLEFPELLEVCARRGLGALELVTGHAHGIAPGLAPGVARRRREQGDAAGVRLAALRVGGLEAASTVRAADLSANLGVPIVAPLAAARADDVERIAHHYVAAGGPLLVACGSDPDRVRELRRLFEILCSSTLGLAWDVRPAEEDLDALRDPVLTAAGPRLRHIRIAGGGPEAAAQEGRGVGSLMGRLTLNGYRGVVAIAPSTSKYRRAWENWLGRNGGWGCGGKSQDETLVRL